MKRLVLTLWMARKKMKITMNT